MDATGHRGKEESTLHQSKTHGMHGPADDISLHDDGSHGQARLKAVPLHQIASDRRCPDLCLFSGLCRASLIAGLEPACHAPLTPGPLDRAQGAWSDPPTTTVRAQECEADRRPRGSGPQH